MTGPAAVACLPARSYLSLNNMDIECKHRLQFYVWKMSGRQNETDISFHWCAIKFQNNANYLTFSLLILKIYHHNKNIFFRIGALAQ